MIMKNIKMILMALLFMPILLSAQVEIAPAVGYMFGGRLNYYQGEVKINDNVDYGISIIVPDISYGTDLEINYTRMDSRLYFTPYNNFPDYEKTDFNASVNYIQIGALKSFGDSDTFRPFGSFSAGTTIFGASNMSNVWRFSITLGLGAKVWISDRVGIILRGRLMMPMVFAGVGGYYGIGGGSSGGGLYVNTYSTIVQGDFSGGLIFSLGK
jgi:hypothetical protein